MPDLTITRFVKYESEGALKAFCDVMFDSHILIKGIRVIEGRQGPFVSMPRQRNKAGKWYDSVVPLTCETRRELTKTILEAYHASTSESTFNEEEAPCDSVISSHYRSAV